MRCVNTLHNLFWMSLAWPWHRWYEARKGWKTVRESSERECRQRSFEGRHTHTHTHTHTGHVSLQYRWSSGEARKHLKEHKRFIPYSLHTRTHKTESSVCPRALLLSAFSPRTVVCVRGCLVSVCICVYGRQRIHRVMVISIQEGVGFRGGGDVLTHAHVTLATSNRCGCRWSTLWRRAIIQLEPSPESSSEDNTKCTHTHRHMVTWRVESHTHRHTQTHTHTHTWVPNLTPVSTSLLLFLPIFPTSILIFKKTACGSPLRLPLPPSLHSKNTLPPSSLTHSLFHPSNFPHPSIPLFLSSLSSSVWALARAQRVFWEGVWHTTASRTRIGRRARVHTHTHTNTHTHSCDCEADRGRQKNRKKKHAEQLSLSLSHTHTHTHTHRGRQVMQRDSASAAEESLWHIDPPLSAFTFSISLLCIFFLSFTFSFLFSSRCTDIKKKKKTANGGVSWQTHTLLVLRKVC